VQLRSNVQCQCPALTQSIIMTFPPKIHSPKDEVYGKQTSNLKMNSTLAPEAAGAWTNPTLAPDAALAPNGKRLAEGSVTTRVAPSVAGKVLNLSVEQTKDLNFPVGCPVWYNFSESQGACLDVYEGLVLSAHLDIYTKTVIVRIERKSVSGPSSIDTVFDDDVAYASNCPVVLSPMDSNSSEKLDGVVIFAKPVKDETGSHIMSYTVSFSSGSRHSFSVEEGVTAGRLKYRETRVASSETSQAAKHSVEHSTPTCSLTVSEEENSDNVAQPTKKIDGVRVDTEFNLQQCSPDVTKLKADHQLNDGCIRLIQSRVDRELSRPRDHETTVPCGRKLVKKHPSEATLKETSHKKSKYYLGADPDHTSRLSFTRKVEKTEKDRCRRLTWEPPRINLEKPFPFANYDGAI
jgi:hypothetical protein